MELARKYFADVKKGWETFKSLEWELGVHSLNACLPVFDAPEAQQFLDDYLLIMIRLLTNQNPKTLGAFERKNIDETLLLALTICVKTLAHHTKHFNVLLRILDSSIPYYAGMKVHLIFYTGFPLVRTQMAKKFAELDGFRVLLNIIRNPDIPWLGADAMHIMLKTLIETCGMVDEDLRENFVSELMKKLLGLTDEQAKRENNDNVTNLIKAIHITYTFKMDKSMQAKKQQIFHKFWMDYTLKMISSGSIVLRLFGWEQVHELIREALNTRPFASAFEVRGAGNPIANGVYNSAKDSSNVLCYVKQSAAPGEPMLTLFGCAMKNKMRWWFISQQDADRPGTDKDIDYYQHKSNASQDREPQPRGWVAVNGHNAGSLGKEPAPSLLRMGKILPEGMTESMYLDSVLPGWILQQGLLNEVFGASPHREVVSRSSKLLVYLADAGVLQAAQLQLIWKVAMQNHDTDILEEIFSLLLSLSVCLNDEMYTVFVDLALESLAQEDAHSSTSPNSAFNKVAHLVEKFAHNPFQDVVGALSEHSSSKLLSLVWTIYKNVNFESIKSSTVIREFLAKCLGLPSGRAIALQSVNECLEQLQSFASLSPTSSSSSSSSTMESTEINATELAAARVILTLKFLISKNIGDAGILELETNGFSSIMIAELARFTSINRKKLLLPTFDRSRYILEISSRLTALRHFYGTAATVKMPFEVIRSLWELLFPEPCELDMLFVMLHSGAVKREQDFPIAEVPVFLNVFNEFFCSPAVDWSQFGDSAYEAFEMYFNGLQNGAKSSKIPSDQIPPHVGLDTLWSVVFNISTPTPQKNSVSLLLKSYETLAIQDSEAHTHLYDRIFSTLTDLFEKPRDAVIKEKISRCVDLLHSAVLNSRPPTLLSHSLRGDMSKVSLRVHFHRTFPQFNYQSQSTINRVEKGSEATFLIDIHPMDSILHLKAKIAFAATLPSAHKVHFDGCLKASKDANKLFEFDLADGTDVYAYFFSNSLTTLKSNFIDSDSLNESMSDFDLFKLPSIGELIVNNSDHFAKLQALAESCDDEAVFKKLWLLLMLLPTQPDLLESVEKITSSISDQDSLSSSPWSALIGHQSLASGTYFLQIIDATLQPATDSQDAAVFSTAADFKPKFLASGGFTAVLDFFVKVSSSGDVPEPLTTAALAVALHILYFLLFETQTPTQVNVELLQELQANSAVVIEKLLSVASNASAAESTAVVHDALATLTALLYSPEAAAQLISNPASQSFIVAVLRSPSKQVREMAAEFAVQVGKSQPVVFSWLLVELAVLKEDDVLCRETFLTLSQLMMALHESHFDSIDWAALAVTLSSKFDNVNLITESQVLLGHLLLLQNFIFVTSEANPPFLDNEVLLRLTKSFTDDFLFTLPTASHDNSPICENPETKQAVFSVLSAITSVSELAFEQVIGSLTELSLSASTTMSQSWGQYISFDVKSSDISFAGLKNQGCTCYMNSLLQQLFMSESIREAILTTPLRECHRSSLSHRSPEELVGCEIVCQWEKSSWRKGRVTAYDALISSHTVIYEDGENATFELTEGRLNCETGNFRLAPVDGDEPVTERQEAAYRVLEQLQRCFCFMKFSKRRFFDPRPLVDACKTLNMNFNVYHQNDATEFCDQLLDRIELATKGDHTNCNVWADTFLSKIFGGKFLYQKIPTDCDLYQEDKKKCGHWQSARQESFLKIELIIRGKDNIDDSLAEYVAGELMDGDNKINCEVCTQKKATVRRTCFDVLPNTLILHLKRFDLDFTTFETVKLNSRMAFETSINLLKYTKEGMEAEERRQMRAAEAAATTEDDEEESGIGATHHPVQRTMSLTEDFVEPNIEDYEYTLQGVLVHAGVAQGGHYYSFAKDPNSEKWFRFDDEDVTQFNPEHIPTQCFGGPPPGNSSNDDDRISNALMLFYKKVKPSDIPPPVVVPVVPIVAPAPAPESEGGDVNAPVVAPKGSRLVDGYEAFQKDVQSWNLQHLLSRYMMDADLHVFVRGLFQSIISSAKQEDGVGCLMRWFTPQNSGHHMQAVQFAVKFLFDVVLHCRERTATQSWVDVLKTTFEVFPDAALWFVQTVVCAQTNSWFDEYLLHCSDPLARSTFVSILALAVAAIAPKDKGTDFLLPYLSTDRIDLNDLTDLSNPEVVPMLLAKLVVELISRILDAPANSRCADEIFLLVRELSAIPCVCGALIDQRAVSYLAFFAIPDLVCADIRSQFAERIRYHRVVAKQDFYPLYQSIFEALAALLGVPQLRKVPLMLERSYNSELLPAAKDAFTVLFNEVCPESMDAQDVIEYKDRTGLKVTLPQVRLMLDRFGNKTDGRLYLDGFLLYYADLAAFNPKDAWKDLNAYGFLNDLTRCVQTTSADATTSIVTPALSDGSGNVPSTSRMLLPNECRRCLCSIQLFQAGLDTAEASAKAIAKRVCEFDEVTSAILIKQTTTRLTQSAPDYTWGNALAKLNDFLRLLLSIDDGLVDLRLREIMLTPKTGIATIILAELRSATVCRANDFDARGLFKRYISFAHDMCAAPEVKSALARLAEFEQDVRTIKGFMPARPNSMLTENDDMMLRSTVLHVEGAGIPEVDGDYTFSSVRQHSGSFSKRGLFENKEVTFYIYKCSVMHGGFQWFISVTPDGKEPGTNDDIDFYFAVCRPETVNHLMPPTSWSILSNKPTSKAPPPRIVYENCAPNPATMTFHTTGLGPLNPLVNTVRGIDSESDHASDDLSDAAYAVNVSNVDYSIDDLDQDGDLDIDLDQDQDDDM